MIFRFGRYALDEEAGELRLDGESVEIQPKPLTLLALLVRERARVVPVEDLFDALWPGVAVTPSSLTRAVSLARRAIGDTHRGEIIKSVARRGYRFCADAVEVDAAAQRAPSAAGEDSAFPFVGRADALARLRTALGEALQGRGGLELVGGPPGIGKTRLLEVFTREAERTGALVLPARSREGEGVPAFWLWVQVLRRLAEHDHSAEVLRAASIPAELGALVPELGGAPEAPAVRSELSPEQGRFLLFDAVARSLARAAQHRPLLLVLEDLQWAGSPSLRMLEHLAFELGDHAILVVGTVREEPRDRDHPLERSLARLRQLPRCEPIGLRGFSRREVAELLERAIGRAAPTDLTSELFARTEGVPLFLREAIRLLAERGDLADPERVRRWGLTLPSQSLDLIRRPLERLSPAAADLVGSGAVLGREFLVTVAGAVGQVAREEAIDLLDEAARAGVIEPAPETPGAWRFIHALFQEAAYAALPTARRAQLHLRAAEELERRHRDDPGRVIAELAHHRHESLAVSDPARAFECAWRAAERAAELLAYEQAATHYAQAVAALEHADPVDPARRLEALLALGQAHRLAGDRPRRREAFAGAMRAARTQGRPLEFARAAIGFCDLSEWSPPSDEEARQAVAAALAGLPEDARSVRARVLTRLAYLSALEAPGEVEAMARTAIALAGELEDAEAFQDAAYVLSFLLAGPDHLAEREALAREAETRARATGTTDATVIGLLDAASDRLIEGDAERARRWRAAAGAVAGADPHLGRVWHLRVFDAGRALVEGRFADAEGLVAEARRIGRRIEHPYARNVEGSLLTFLARQRGDDAQVLRFVEPMRPIRTGPVQFVQSLAGRALYAVGRKDEARQVFEELAGEGFDRIPRNIRWYATITEGSFLCAELGDAGRAEELCALLEPHAEQHAMLSCFLYCGPIAHCLARLHETLGRLERASELFEDAVLSCEAIGARPTRARVLLDHGRLLARRGERARSRERIGESAKLAASLGMTGVEAAAREALAPSGR
jgi:DNA-binding winged helix-turn-helix (wHTH) protein/tetratricopeptide (TPR) repeat protein